MSTEIELYAGEDFKLIGTVPLSVAVRPAVSRMLHLPPDSTFSILLDLYQVFSDDRPSGTPSVYNLVPEFGYAKVIVIQNKKVIYQHPHPVEEIVTPDLQRWLAKNHPSVTTWGFRIAIGGLPPARFIRPTPAVEGVINLKPLSPGEATAISIRQIEEEPPPISSLAELGVESNGSASHSAKVSIVIPYELRADLDSRPLSTQVEEGGFLVGRVFRDRRANPEHYILLLTRAETAEHSGASLLRFTFSGDSYSTFKRRLRASSNDEKMLGWYHTHLFPATDDFGLSSIDVREHFSTYGIPWQVAGLINFDSGVRTLRFYNRQGNQMVLCPFFVTK